MRQLPANGTIPHEQNTNEQEYSLDHLIFVELPNEAIYLIQ
jgi:hypothetical protein